MTPYGQLLALIKEVKDIEKKICCIINGNSTLTFLIQEFADNAAAITGGLSVGQIYRTGDNLKVVH